MADGKETEATAPETATGDEFQWAIVEIMGHRRHVGRAREEQRFGSTMLRIDVPKYEAGPDLFAHAKGEEPKPPITWTTYWYGGPSIFSYVETDEATVMKLAERPYSAPSRYLPSPDHAEDDEGAYF